MTTQECIAVQTQPQHERLAALAKRLIGMLGRLLLALILWLFFSGCATERFSDALSDGVVGPSYQPKNVHRESPVLPAGLRRVAVLPLARAREDALLQAGQETLQPVLYEELSRAKAFEVIFVSPSQMKQWTGRTSWKAEEKLPRNFLDAFREKLGCDGVLFCQLTQFQPYQPVMMGWSLKLVESAEGRIWWAVDEVFDGGDQMVVNGARRYYLEHFQTAPSLADSRSILGSPQRFAHYTLGEILATLPAR